jgi:hypothetical protein
MEKEVALLVTGALISLISSLITSIFNYRLSRRQWQDQAEHEKQRELRRNLTFGLEDVQRHGLGPLRGNDDVNDNTGILPPEVGKLEVEKKELIQTLESINDQSVKMEHLLYLALEMTGRKSNHE